MKKIKVIKIEPVRWDYFSIASFDRPYSTPSIKAGALQEIEIEDTAEALREVVGGHFDMHYVMSFVYHEKWFNAIPGNGDLVFVVNGTGKCDGLPPCMLFGGEVFCGTVIIYNAAGFEGSGENVTPQQSICMMKKVIEAQYKLVEILKTGGIR